MKISIPKVIMPVDLGEYAAELTGKTLQVWVNPSMRKLQEYNDLVTELQTNELAAARETLLSEKPSAEEPRREENLFRLFSQLSNWLNMKRNRKTEGTDPKILKWYAEIWSQGPDDTRWSLVELQALEVEDPAFLSWMISQTWNVRSVHIEKKKKV